MTGESLPVVLRLRSELDRLEAIADAAIRPPRPPWKSARLWRQRPENAAFMTANAPEVVLRTIQAHRKIVEIHYPAWSAAGDICFACDDGSGVESTWPCATLRALASIYFPESDG